MFKHTIRSAVVVAVLLGAASALVAAPTISTPTDNLFGWWLMGENATVTGDTINSIPDQVNGNTAVAQGDPQRAVGYPFDPYDGDSYDTYCDGTLDLVRVDFGTLPGSTPETAPDGYSMSFWAKPELLNGRMPFYKLFGGAGFMWCMYETNGKFKLKMYNGVTVYESITTNVVLQADQWTHLVCVRDTADTGAIRIYADGVLAGETTGTGSATMGGTGYLSIGAKGDGEFPTTGAIDDFRYYTEVLDVDEVAAIYNNGKGDFGLGTTPVAGTLIYGK